MRSLSLFALVIAASARAAEVPADIKAFLDKPGTVTLSSLDPSGGKDKDKEKFHGVTVLGKAELDGEVKKTIIAALSKALEGRPDKGARCFIPRHGLAIKSGKDTLDLVICFQCSWVEVHVGDKKTRIAISDSAAKEFNKALKDAKVPLPKGPGTSD
jgi:hypothetical protein